MWFPCESSIGPGLRTMNMTKKKRYENRFENSSKDSLSEETKLVERKLKDDRARKRTRGPYRKSHLK